MRLGDCDQSRLLQQIQEGHFDEVNCWVGSLSENKEKGEDGIELGVRWRVVIEAVLEEEEQVEKGAAG